MAKGSEGINWFFYMALFAVALYFVIFKILLPSFKGGQLMLQW